MVSYSPKIKIYFSIALWLLVAGALFGHFFPSFDASNQNVVDSFANARKDLDKIKAEQESYRLAKQDLNNVGKEHIQPDGFFSKDITLVNELQIIENLAAKYHVAAELSGLSGTSDKAAKAATHSAVVTVPYSLSVRGDFAAVVQFLENMEHLPFVTTISSLSVGVSDGGVVNVVLSANFYLARPSPAP